MSRLFGTDGVRGIANKELTAELAFNLGKAGGYVLGKQAKRPVFIIGVDTRVSGDLLENALAAGILAVGGNVIKVGVIPTPAIAYLVRHFRADAGVMISASHNPFEYNGIKFFNGQGFKLDDAIEDAIEDIIVRDIDVNSHITGEEIGKCLEAEENGQEAYIEFLLSKVDFRLDGVRIAMDCANGAAYQVAEEVYRRLGAQVFAIGNRPDGVNINDGCGSTHPEALQDIVVAHEATVGFAYDGDADRLIAVDERGRVIDGDKLISICAAMLKKEERLNNNIVTATVMSNIGFHKYMEELGCGVRVTKVGDRYVLEDMLKTGSSLGGEQSGHIIFLDETTTGDGILSSLQLARAMIHDGRPVSEMADDVEIFPQVLKNASVKNEWKTRYEQDKEVAKAIEKVDKEMEGKGRLLIRPSGTEPLVRVMIEGQDLDHITELAEELAVLITKRLG